MNKNLLDAEQVASTLGITDNTLKMWYKFKVENPENEYSLMLPEIVRVGPRNKRCWKKSDLKKLIKFQTSIPHGKNGVLGSVTQRYQKKQPKTIEERN